MIHVKDVIGTKNDSLWSVSPSAPVQTALNLLTEKNIGAVPVLNEDGSIAGIFSERDFTRACAKDSLLCLDCPVGDVMTTRVICISPEQVINDCMLLMTDKRVRHLPVITDGKMVGIISIGDVVKTVMEDKDILIDQLQHYIEGGL